MFRFRKRRKPHEIILDQMVTFRQNQDALWRAHMHHVEISKDIYKLLSEQPKEVICMAKAPKKKGKGGGKKC